MFNFIASVITPINTAAIANNGFAIKMVFIPLEIFELINPYLFTGYIDLFLAAFHDPIPWNIIMNATITCTLWSALFIYISFYHFKGKEILT